jgi:GNAT superfamily N-acetyltransferase
MKRRYFLLKQCLGSDRAILRPIMNEQMEDIGPGEGIRLAGVADAEVMARLFVQLGYGDEPGRLVADLLAMEPGRQVLVSENLHGVTGVLVLHLLRPLHLAPGWALISALVVDEEARGQGWGAALLAAAEQMAREAGCGQIELSSSPHRERAHHFYQQQGYREQPTRFVKSLLSQ